MKFFWWVRLSGTVIPKIWWQIFLLLIYTAAVVCIENYIPWLHKDFPGSDLTLIIGTVIGLLLTFRTNSAYERYKEGRQLWSNMAQEIRKLTRAIWSGVKEVDAKDVIEKKSAINLCTAFILSTKHYLREEYAYDYEDYDELLDHLPKFFNPAPKIPLNQSQKGFQAQAYDYTTPTNIPVELSYYLTSYCKYVEENKLADDWAISGMVNGISGLTDCLAGFERILRTPTPLIYSVHLQECVWLFLLAIPYQTIGDVGPWFTIPIVGFAAFFFLGILAIGFEIENPFGYNANDLPIEDYCNVMLLEIQKIMTTEPPVADKWLFSPENRPFGPMCSLTATQLAELPIHEAKDILKTVAQTAIIASETDYPARSEAKSITESRKRISKGYQSM